MIDSLITIAPGVFVVLASYGKIQLSKNPGKNSEYLMKYGVVLRVLGMALIVIGLIMVFAR